jgi:hypothetical protein
MAIKYVTGNLITSGTLDSVSTEDASGFYNKENLYNKIQALPLRFTAKSTQYIIIDLASDIATTFIGVFNHNLTTSPGVFKIKGWTSANGPITDGTEANATLDETLTVTSGHKNSFKTFSETLRWYAILITDASNTENPEVGELVLGTHSTFTKNFVYPYTEILRYIRGESVTPYGQRWLNQKAKVKRFLLDFLGVTDANLLSEIQAFFEAIEGDDPFVFIPNDAAAYSWFVNCMNDLSAERVHYNYNNVSLELVEQGRGITLL